MLGQSLSADVSIKHDSTGTTVLDVSNLSLTLGTSTLGVSITQTPGQTIALTISPAGVTGTIAVTANLVGVTGVSFGSGIPIALNITPSSLTVQLGTLNADGTVATPASATILGQTLSGVFTLQRTTDAGPDGVLHTSDDRTIIQFSAVDVSAHDRDGGRRREPDERLGAVPDHARRVRRAGERGRVDRARIRRNGSIIGASVADASIHVSTLSDRDQRGVHGDRRRAADADAAGRPVPQRFAEGDLADDRRTGAHG